MKGQSRCKLCAGQRGAYAPCTWQTKSQQVCTRCAQVADNKQERESAWWPSEQAARRPRHQTKSSVLMFPPPPPPPSPRRSPVAARPGWPPPPLGWAHRWRPCRPSAAAARSAAHATRVCGRLGSGQIKRHSGITTGPTNALLGCRCWFKHCQLLLATGPSICCLQQGRH